MHSTSINLTMQALQSKSLARLERTVMPMAENVASIHDRVTGDLSAKIDDLHRIITAIANSTPSLVARDRSVERDSATTSLLEPVPTCYEDRMLEASPPRSPSHQPPSRQYDRRGSHVEIKNALNTRASERDSAYYSGSMSFERDGRHMDWSFETGSPSDARASIGADLHAQYAASESIRRDLSIPRRESTTLPFVAHHFDDGHPSSWPEAEHDDIYSRQSILPPPAMPPDAPGGPPPVATPSSFFGSPKRPRSDTVDKRTSQASVRPPAVRSPKRKSEVPVVPPNGLDGSAFERLLFRNSAILADVRGVLLEYASIRHDEPDPRFAVDMVSACKEARIYVVRKREHREHGGSKVMTSVWTLSDDGAVRIQQKLSEVHETVPYCSYFQPEKVSIPPTGGEIELRLHGEHWGDALVDQKKTTWVNYVFASANDAVAFQSSIYGRSLLGSYRTTKSTVLHSGIRGAFTFEEQFANIEMLRLWEDDGISTPGAAGGVLALLHVSSNFGEGWARWWVNNSKQQVRITSDGPKFAKVKGIDLTIFKPDTTAAQMRSPSLVGESLPYIDTDLNDVARNPGRRIPVKKVTALRIEFKTEEERDEFVALALRVQQRLIPLPDL